MKKFRKINSFSRRVGQGFTQEDKVFLSEHLTSFLFNPEHLDNSNNSTQKLPATTLSKLALAEEGQGKLARSGAERTLSYVTPPSNNSTQKLPAKVEFQSKILEIGFGYGDHLIDVAMQNPDSLIIGVEAFISGVHNAIQLAVENNVRNIKIFPDDVDIIIEQFPAKCFDEIYILFPDPWPKKRHYKRRIINEYRLEILLKILKPKGKLIIASDHEDYQLWIEEKLNTTTNISYSLCNILPDYKPTRYHQKAIKDGRIAKFYIVTIK